MSEAEGGASGSLLARLDGVRRAIDRAHTVADVGDLLTDVEKLKRYASAAKFTLEQQNAIARVWFLVQRRGGAVWQTTPKQGPGQYQQRSQNGTVDVPPTLAELGLTKRQASHWLTFAKWPEDAFEEILDRLAEVRRLTTSGLVAELYRGPEGASDVTLGAVGVGRAVVYGIDYRELLARTPAESVDLLITDPPYSTDVDDIAAFAHDWLGLAVPTITRSGRAYICIGAYPAELYAYLDYLLEQHHLELEQVLVWTYRNTLGPAPSDTYKSNWQAILYLRGPDAPPLDCPLMTEQFSVMDIAAPDGRHGTRAHAWQKPDALAERLVRHASAEGATVLDPFAGTGAFLAAAARLGRRAVGSETNLDMLDWCAQRGIEVVHAET